jgi:hypothetical protein
MVTGAFAWPHAGLPHWLRAEDKAAEGAGVDLRLSATKMPAIHIAAIAIPITHLVLTPRDLVRLFAISYPPSAATTGARSASISMVPSLILLFHQDA